MKKKISLPLLIALLLAAGAILYLEESARFSVSSAGDKGLVLHDGNGVRVEQALHSKILRIGKNVQTSEESYDVTIVDGQTPMVLAFQASCCNGLTVQMVTDRAVVLRVEPGVGIGTSEFYVADRLTREIRHYLLDEASYLATTHDGTRIVARDKKGLVLQDADLQEVQRTIFARPQEYVAQASVSPDGRFVAFLTWNGGHDEDEKWHAYAYDLVNNGVIDLGPAVEAAAIQWKDASAFAGVRKIPATNGFSEEEYGVYELHAP